MSHSDSELSSSSDSGSSNSTELINFDVEVEPGSSHNNEPQNVCTTDQRDYNGVLNPWDGEPIASQEWVDEYERELRREENTAEELLRRRRGLIPVRDWCKCGNCRIERLSEKNGKECLCCHEIDACQESLSSEEVTREDGRIPQCITLHPGFRAVCLEKWSLKLAADSYRTKYGRRYKKGDSEARFYRSISYRAFSHLVHGHLGHRRIALPACAYHCIRSKFVGQDESITGYSDDDE